MCLCAILEYYPDRYSQLSYFGRARYQIHDKIEIMKSFMLLDTFGSFSFTCTAMLYCIEQHSAAVRKRNKCYLVVLRDLRF
jgi:hypothetical protein